MSSLSDTVVTFEGLGKQGRLGNQLFQISATLSYTAQWIRAKCASSDSVPSTEICRLVRFPLDHFDAVDVFPFLRPLFVPLDTLTNFRADAGNSTIEIREKSFAYEPFRFTDDALAARYISLCGYFQSNKNWDIGVAISHDGNEYSMIDFLRHIVLRPSEAYLSAVADFFSFLNIGSSDTAFFHVRRGDYLAIQHILPCQSISYYASAMHSLAQRSCRVWLYFSDDPQWTTENIVSYGAKYYPHIRHIVVDNTQRFLPTHIHELIAMSQCKHAVMANSSFSWWGATLRSISDGQLTLAPSQWFGIYRPFDLANYSDIYDASWTIVRSF